MDLLIPERSENFAVYKYPFLIADEVRIQMPKGARLLHIGQLPLTQSDLQLWAHIDKRQPMVERCLLLYGTGHPMPAEPGKYLNTVVMHGGALVWHIYDAGESL